MKLFSWNYRGCHTLPPIRDTVNAGAVGAVAKVCWPRELQIKTESLSLPDTDASRAVGAGEDGKPSAD